jgi:iron(III) transport system permease protein
LSLLAGLPLIVPGIIIGLSLRALVIQFKLLPLYQSIWIFVLAYIPLIIPYSLRYVEPAMLQISPALEEQARVSGARWSTSSRLILLPLLQVSLISCWVLGFLFSMREFAASSLLSSFGNQVVGPQLFETFESDPSGITSAFAAVVALVGIVVAGAALIMTRRLFKGAPDASESG